MAELAGFTNHAIGQDTIAGGIRDCGQGSAMIVADARWQNIVAVTMTGTDLSARILGPHTGRQSFKRALDCKF